MQPGRVLVKEGAVQEEVKPENLRKRYVYLFNDLIIITKQKKIGKEIRHMSPLYQLSGIKRTSISIFQSIDRSRYPSHGYYDFALAGTNIKLCVGSPRRSRHLGHYQSSASTDSYSIGRRANLVVRYTGRFARSRHASLPNLPQEGYVSASGLWWL